MKTVKTTIGAVCIISLVFFSCKRSSDEIIKDETQEETTSVNDPDITDPDFATNTKDTTFSNAVLINFTDGGAVVTNPFENNGVSVSVSNADVTVTSTNTSTEINYVLSGTAADGSFKIYSDYKFGLGLNGVSITSSKSPAINIQSGKKVSVLLVGNTNNRLVDAATYSGITSGEDAKGTFFSEGQLVFDGSGSLLLRGNYSHAICSDDYVRINSGTIKISGAVKDGIHANDYLRIDGGTLDITTTGDALECEDDYVLINGGNLTLKTTGEKAAGIKSEGITTINNNAATINITVSGKAAKGIKTTGDLVINNGTINIATTGDAFYDTSDADISSASGLKSDGNLLIENGTITINSSGSGGKGISIDGTLTINNGTITVNTTGGRFVYGNDDTAAKAVKSDGDLTINGGNITIKTTQTEAEGLESKATLTINGGKLIIEAYDDGINASNHIAINGGTIYVYSTTNDAIDSNGTLTVTGGTVVAVGAASPEAGFDCDNSTFKITGGTIIGLGGSTSTPTSNVSTQRSLVYNISSSLSLNQIIHIETTAGTVLDFKVPRAFSSRATLLFSSPNLAASTSHTIYTGGSLSGGSDFYGLITGASYTKGTSAATFTTSSVVTTVGTSGGR